PPCPACGDGIYGAKFPLGHLGIPAYRPLLSPDGEGSVALRMARIARGAGFRTVGNRSRRVYGKVRGWLDRATIPRSDRYSGVGASYRCGVVAFPAAPAPVGGRAAPDQWESGRESPNGLARGLHDLRGRRRLEGTGCRGRGHHQLIVHPGRSERGPEEALTEAELCLGRLATIFCRGAPNDRIIA